MCFKRVLGNSLNEFRENGPILKNCGPRISNSFFELQGQLLRA